MERKEKTTAHNDAIHMRGAHPPLCFSDSFFFKALTTKSGSPRNRNCRLQVNNETRDTAASKPLKTNRTSETHVYVCTPEICPSVFARLETSTLRRV